MRTSWYSYHIGFSVLSLFLLCSEGRTSLHRQMLSLPNEKRRSSLTPRISKKSSTLPPIDLKHSLHVDRRIYTSSSCSSSRRTPFIVIDSECPCFLQYTIRAAQIATWDVFLIPTSSFLRWERIRYLGDPAGIVEEYSTRNKTVQAFDSFETPDRNAFINGNFTLVVRENSEEEVCLYRDTEGDGTSIVFEAMPKPCPVKMEPNETSPRIVGGTEVSKGFRWMAVIWLVATTDPLPICGGVHISPGYIATASHCLIQQAPSAYRARLDTLQASNGDFFQIRRAFTHPKYRTLPSNEAVFDITILELTEVPSSPVLKINTDAAVPKFNETVTTAGWGYISEDWSALPSPNRLRRVDMPVTSTSACEQQYSDMDSSVHICAGRAEGGCDSCLSDSGGPLRAVVNGSEVLVGIVSYGTGCARAGTPGVYTRVSRVGGWVEDTLRHARATRGGPAVWGLVGGLVGGVAALVVAGVVVVVVVKRRKPAAGELQRATSSLPSSTGVSE